MSDDESRVIRQVFAGALQHDPEERDDYLDRVCAGTPELCARVAALLDAHAVDFETAITQPGSQPVAGCARVASQRSQGGREFVPSGHRDGPEFAMLFVGASVAILVAPFVIEPATVKTALGQ